MLKKYINISKSEIILIKDKKELLYLIKNKKLLKLKVEHFEKIGLELINSERIELLEELSNYNLFDIKKWNYQLAISKTKNMLLIDWYNNKYSINLDILITPYENRQNKEIIYYVLKNGFDNKKLIDMFKSEDNILFNKVLECYNLNKKLNNECLINNKTKCIKL